MSYGEIRSKILSKVAEVALTVEKLDDPELKKFRITTCEGCKVFNPDGRTCGICTCPMDAKAGILTNKNPLHLFRHELTHCPLGKWNDKEVANHYRKLDGKELLK